MLMLTSVSTEVPVAAPTVLDNILTLSLVGLLILVVVIAVIRKAAADKKSVLAESMEAPAPAPAPLAPGSAGELKLHDVAPKTAAMLMAIVADKLQKPINELRVISIKEVE